MGTVIHGHNRTAPGEKKSRTYCSWVAMKQRCLNKKHKWYHYYGGRGITVCAKWMTFIGFLEDMGERPLRLTLERTNVDLPYCKSNCIWADIRSQNRNRRRGLRRTNIGSEPSSISRISHSA